MKGDELWAFYRNRSKFNNITFFKIFISYLPSYSIAITYFLYGKNLIFSETFAQELGLFSPKLSKKLLHIQIFFFIILLLRYGICQNKI